MNWNWRYNKINSTTPVKFLHETGVSRPGIVVVHGETNNDILMMNLCDTNFKMKSLQFLKNKLATFLNYLFFRSYF